MVILLCSWIRSTRSRFNRDKPASTAWMVAVLMSLAEYGSSRILVDTTVEVPSSFKILPILLRLSQTVSKSRVEIVDSAIQRVAHRLNLFIVTRLDHKDSVVPAAKADF